MTYSLLRWGAWLRAREEKKTVPEVRKKITSQKKEILEGSEEWDVLYRKYYSEEMRRMGVQTAPEEQRRH